MGKGRERWGTPESGVLTITSIGFHAFPSTANILRFEVSKKESERAILFSFHPFSSLKLV